MLNSNQSSTLLRRFVVATHGYAQERYAQERKVKIWASLFPLAAKAALLATFFYTTQSHADTRTVIAHWTFSESSGPVINAGPVVKGQSSVNHNGWVGYTASADDDTQVERNADQAIFNGNRNSIILIDDAHHTDLNPGDGSLIVTMEFQVNQSALDDKALAPKETWNLIQKGRFNNTGGQWKLQIRKGPQKRLFLQCLINDNKPGTKREAGQIHLEDRWVANKHTLLGRCTLNRQTNELKLELTDLKSGKTVASVANAISKDFGAVAPESGACGTPESFGGNVAIGNKPLCPDQELDTNDAFQGAVSSVLIERF